MCSFLLLIIIIIIIIINNAIIVLWKWLHLVIYGVNGVVLCTDNTCGCQKGIVTSFFFSSNIVGTET